MPPSPKRSKEGVGPLVAIVVIVIILGIGGIYYLQEQIADLRGTVDVTSQTR